MSKPSIVWQSECHTLKQRSVHLFNNPQLTDCNFLVGCEPNQARISSHKIMLIIASPVFEAMFNGALPEKNDPIALPDVEPDAFRALLKYIYTDEISISNIDDAYELYYAAKKYMLPFVEQHCSKYIRQHLNAENVCREYEYALSINDTEMAEKCMEFIRVNTENVLNQEDFCNTSPTTLLKILDQDRLNITELGLIKALKQYRMDYKVHINNDVQLLRTQRPPPRRRLPQPLSRPGGSFPPDKVHLNNDVQLFRTQRSKELPWRGFPQPKTLRKSREHHYEDIDHDDTETDAQADGGDADVPQPKLQNNASGITDNWFRQAITKIRFLTLTPIEFATSVIGSNILTESESLAIIVAITKGTSYYVSLPAGLSNNSICRNHEQSISDPRAGLVGGFGRRARLHNIT